MRGKQRSLRRKQCFSSQNSVLAQANLHHRFLDGFKWSRGDRGNLNTRYEKLNVLKMQKRAAKIGLADPLQIVTSELNAAAGIVQRRDADQRRRLSLWRTTLPASNDDQNDDQEDTENNLQVQAEEEIDTKHESDDDGDDDGMIHEDSDGDHADVYYEQDGLRSAVNPKAGTRCVIWMSMDEAI